MDLQLQMAQTYDYIKSISARCLTLTPPPFRGAPFAHVAKVATQQVTSSEIQYEITADSALRLWQHGQLRYREVG